MSKRVVTTSSTPNLVFRRVGIRSSNAPADMEQMIIAGMSAGADQARAPVPISTATMAPEYSCASAPMFHNLARKATATASPVKINGVARFRVSSRANLEPTAPLMINPKTAKGFPPATIARKDAMKTVAVSAKIGGRNLLDRLGCGITSRRMHRLLLGECSPRHPTTQLSRCYFPSLERRANSAF